MYLCLKNITRISEIQSRFKSRALSEYPAHTFSIVLFFILYNGIDIFLKTYVPQDEQKFRLIYDQFDVVLNLGVNDFFVSMVFWSLDKDRYTLRFLIKKHVCNFFPPSSCNQLKIPPCLIFWRPACLFGTSE